MYIFLITCLIAISASSAEPVARLQGVDFAGGAAERFGDTQHGMSGVNYVYAQPSGAHSEMGAAFELAETPSEDLALFILGRDDNFDSVCPIRISVNGETVHDGPSGFPDDAFEWRTFSLPALEAGEQNITITNPAPEGQAGMPPWFMAARIIVAPEGFDPDAPPSFQEDAVVTLPDQAQPLITPLPEGAEPGFALRGTKGWLWAPEQYIAEVPALTELKMNFLMICYGSMCDIENYAWGNPACNRWWEPLPEAKRTAFEELLRLCQDRDIELCLSMNPNLTSARALEYDDAEDFEDLWQHYEWMQQRGMRWFCLALDDITRGIDAAGQTRVANKLFERLRENDPEAQFIFCPTYYWGDGTGDEARPYLDVLAGDLHPEIYVFWTGAGPVGAITHEDAATYKSIVQHPVIIWDNYPVNDAHPTMHLGPVTRRDPELADICYGYMGNPMHSESEINRLPLATCADFAYNPEAYEPRRAIGRAILWQAETPEQQQVLRDLVELYPGMLVYEALPNHNPLTVRFDEIIAQPHNVSVARAYLEHVREVASRLDAAFPQRYAGAKATLQKNLDSLQERFIQHYGEAAATR